jgi:hypothetical protein
MMVGIVRPLPCGQGRGTVTSKGAVTIPLEVVELEPEMVVLAAGVDVGMEVLLSNNSRQIPG